MKLWIVNVETEALVLAETKQDAQDFADKIMADMRGSEYADARPYRGAMPMNWDFDALVYHKGDADITAAKAIAEYYLPEPK